MLHKISQGVRFPDGMAFGGVNLGPRPAICHSFPLFPMHFSISLELSDTFLEQAISLVADAGAICHCLNISNSLRLKKKK